MVFGRVRLAVGRDFAGSGGHGGGCDESGILHESESVNAQPPARGFPATERDSTPLSEAGDRMADWEKRIGAVTLFVPDLDRARQFYQDVFGLDAQPAGDGTVVLRFQDMYLFLHAAAAAQEPLPEVLEEARKGAGQFAVIVGDVDAVCSELAGRGVRPLSGPADRPWGMRTVTFADPGGHIWEIAQEIPGDAS
jgi:catechol 2,3-dioxygenase-like lactoylglutathione lyase family enzyme